MNQRKLLKELHINPDMRVRDFIGFSLASDMPKIKQELNGHIDAHTGDYIMILSFKWKDKAAYEKARRQTKRLLKKFKIGIANGNN